MKFEESLNFGEIGQVIYLEAQKDTIEALDGIQADFKVIATGETVELKTDYYDLNKTENFFIERYSNLKFQTPGGPWQSAHNGVTQWIYLFIKNLTFFKFNVNDLLPRLEKLIPNLSPVNVANSTWTSQGYIVPRRLLADLCTEHKLEVNVKSKVKR